MVLGGTGHQELGRSRTLEELGNVASPSWMRASEWHTSHPQGMTWTLSAGSLGVAGSLNQGTLKEFITARAKGGFEAPYATRPGRPVAGMDVADKGGTYKSYNDMMQHRLRHIRSRSGPNQRFERAHGPPTTSYEYGYGDQRLRPPHHPVSTTIITRQHEAILRATGGSKGR
mmetsp:Transcript_85174/g.198037  ORF Transcript_85174/g.198037 Transcript_85174/m.198037 type:complete len:172 (+) Transcript_85174:103-618(+)